MPYKNSLRARIFNTEYKRQWRKLHREHVNLQAKLWRTNNPDKYKEAQTRYKQNNPEKYHLSQIRSEQKRKGKRIWNLEERRLARQRRRAKLNSVEVSDFTVGEWKIVQDEFGWLCAYCGDKTKLTQDHVIPLSKEGNHTYENIVPACKSCNSSKRNLTSSEFLQRMKLS